MTYFTILACTIWPTIGRRHET